MHWLDSAVDGDYEACPNMAYVACAREVQTRATGVGCVESSEWSVPCEQTERHPSRDRCKDGMTCARTC
jgi:hypothetical protein